jgi:hypothetical protein
MNARILLISLFVILSLAGVSKSQITHKVNISSEKFNFSKEKGDDGLEYDAINYHRGFHLEEIGKPDLPVIYVRLIIPVNQDVDSVIATEPETIEKKGRYIIYPQQPDIRTSLYGKKPGFVPPDEVRILV